LRQINVTAGATIGFFQKTLAAFSRLAKRALDL